MAQITLNTKKTSESFTIDDSQIIYVNTLYIDGVASGSVLTIVDRANATTSTIDVEESPSAVAALSTSLFQVTLTSRATPYLNVSRVIDIITSGSTANISYDNNGNIYTTLETSMTTATILSAISVEQNVPLQYEALLEQTGTDAPVATVLKNTLGFTPTWVYVATGRYSITNAGSFLSGKVTSLISTPSAGVTTLSFRQSDNEFRVYTYDNTDTPADDVLNTPTTLKIYIWP